MAAKLKSCSLPHTAQSLGQLVGQMFDPHTAKLSMAGIAAGFLACLLEKSHIPNRFVNRNGDELYYARRVIR
jgi:hypothetical protein